MLSNIQIKGKLNQIDYFFYGWKQKASKCSLDLIQFFSMFMHSCFFSPFFHWCLMFDMGKCACVDKISSVILFHFCAFCFIYILCIPTTAATGCSLFFLYLLVWFSCKQLPLASASIDEGKIYIYFQFTWSYRAMLAVNFSVLL